MLCKEYHCKFFDITWDLENQIPTPEKFNIGSGIQAPENFFGHSSDTSVQALPIVDKSHSTCIHQDSKLLVPIVCFDKLTEICKLVYGPFGQSNMFCLNKPGKNQMYQR